MAASAAQVLPASFAHLQLHPLPKEGLLEIPSQLND